MTNQIEKRDIKVVIGLGNPGKQFTFTRHNIGFAVLDIFAQQYAGVWKEKDNYLYAEINYNGKKIMLVKPQTFMNESGRVMPYLAKKGIGAEHIIVVHDELEIAFAKVAIKVGGSHRGHNGLRSIISFVGANFLRLRCGIGRPEKKEDVGRYVLQIFSEPQSLIVRMINDAIALLESIL